MKYIKAWIEKYILKIISPSTCSLGYKYRWDYLIAMKRKRNTATWFSITFEGMPITFQCSNCGHTEWFKLERCPKCKATMEDANG